MKLIHFYIKLVLLVGAICSSQTVHAEKFLARFTFREYTTNALGRLVYAVDTTQVEIEECAADMTPALDPKTLVLVYNTDDDEVQVVRKSDGANVCTVFSFSDGSTVTSADGKRQMRQAFLSLPDHSGSPLGSIAGPIERKLDDTGNIVRFFWSASFQIGIPRDNEVIVGQLCVERKFVPGMR